MITLAYLASRDVGSWEGGEAPLNFHTWYR